MCQHRKRGCIYVFPCRKGSCNGYAKLVETEVITIRFMLKHGSLQREVAKFFPVKQPAVSKVKTRRTWRHVK